jgi:hypothetical protein
MSSWEPLPSIVDLKLKDLDPRSTRAVQSLGHAWRFQHTLPPDVSVDVLSLDHLKQGMIFNLPTYTVNLVGNTHMTSIYPFWNPRPWDVGHATNLEKPIFGQILHKIPLNLALKQLTAM